MKLLKVALLMVYMVFLPVTQAKVVVVPMPTERQVPSDESLRRLAEVTQFDRNVDKLNQQSQQMIMDLMKKGFADAPKNETLTPEQDIKVRELTQKFILEMSKEFNSTSTRQHYLSAYIEANKAVFSQQEIDAMIAFYTSPIGQQIVAKQDEFAIENMKRMMAFTQQFQQQLLKEKLPKFIAEMEKVTGKNLSSH